MNELLSDVRRALQSMDLTILAVKAKGGYKHRREIRLSDRELEELEDDCERRLRLLAVAHILAKRMLREPAPSIHARWNEYQARYAELVDELGLGTAK